jgi:phosphosulfolactate synthase (CoM biosynthesis protein A)
MTETTFSFIPRAARSTKPRKTGLTEIRGPYYSAYGPRHLADVLETVGAWVDGIKYAGGSFALMPASARQNTRAKKVSSPSVRPVGIIPASARENG